MTTTDPEPTWRRRRRRAVAAAAVVVVILLAGFGWRTVRDAAAGPDASSLSCSWPARIEHANSDQAGLIRCYLRAVAQHSAGELRSVVRAADDDGPTGFPASDFAHAADAHSGTATVIVAGNESDSADAEVSIRYADGVRESHELHLANPRSSHSWRFWDIGSYPGDPNVPPAAVPEPGH